MATKLTPKQKAALAHPDKLGEGAKKRKHLKNKEKGAVIATEWSKGTLHAGSGKIVPKGKKGEAQMKAIILSESGKMKKVDKPASPEYGKELLAKDPIKKAIIEKWQLLKAKINNLSSFVDMTKPLLEEPEEKPEGNAAKANFTEDQADPEQLKMGIEHEMEHTDDQETAKKTALDHLVEDPQYYTHLDEMEAQHKGGEETPEGEALPTEENEGEEETTNEDEPMNEIGQEEIDSISQNMPESIQSSGDEDEDLYNELSTVNEAKKKSSIGQAPTDETASAEVPEGKDETGLEELTDEEEPEDDLDLQLKRQELEHMEEKHKIEMDFLKKKRQLELDAMKKKIKAVK